MPHADLPRRVDHSRDAAADAIDAGRLPIVNIKPGRVGGYLEARAHPRRLPGARRPGVVRRHARDRLGRAANVALAALPGFTLPGDISASGRYFAEDVTEPFVLGDGEHRGQLRVPDAAGTGVTVREELVRDWAGTMPVVITR